MTPQIDLAVRDEIAADEEEAYAIVEGAIRKTIEVAQLSLPPEAELSVVLAGDETLQALNREWRDKDKPTNVLSFPSEEVEPGETPGILLGDIVISMETTAREAELENKHPDHHFTHLIIHGFLHLFGYDHETTTDAEIMESLETRILAELNIENPY